MCTLKMSNLYANNFSYRRRFVVYIFMLISISILCFCLADDALPSAVSESVHLSDDPDENFAVDDQSPTPAAADDDDSFDDAVLTAQRRKTAAFADMVNIDDDDDDFDFPSSPLAFTPSQIPFAATHRLKWWQLLMTPSAVRLVSGLLMQIGLAGVLAYYILREKNSLETELAQIMKKTEAQDEQVEEFKQIIGDMESGYIRDRIHELRDRCRMLQSVLKQLQLQAEKQQIKT